MLHFGRAQGVFSRPIDMHLSSLHLPPPPLSLTHTRKYMSTHINFNSTQSPPVCKPNHHVHTTQSALYHTIMFTPHNDLRTTPSCSHHTIIFVPHYHVHFTQSSSYHTIMFTPHNHLCTTSSCSHHTITFIPHNH